MLHWKVYRCLVLADDLDEKEIVEMSFSREGALRLSKGISPSVDAVLQKELKTIKGIPERISDTMDSNSFIMKIEDHARAQGREEALLHQQHSKSYLAN